MLDTALEVTVGDDVTFTLSIVNAGDTPIEFTFRDACRADFAISTVNGQEIRRYSDDRAFAGAISTADLQPGETASFEAEWPDPVPGDYTVDASLRVHERNVHARTAFSV